MEAQIRNRIVDHVNFIFPKITAPPRWRQEPHKTTWFDICMDAQLVGKVSSADVRDLIGSERPDLVSPSRTHKNADSMCDAWEEWLYAREKFGAGTQSSLTPINP